jgi:23S rRNA (cytidine1920-2'-O)/16S rRNA (cytidine1409-2'-O)-methyltransferase
MAAERQDAGAVGGGRAGGPGRSRVRLDRLLVERAVFPSRERAAAAILAGRVRVGGEPVTKAGRRFPPDAEVEVSGPAHPFASRGGLKLAAALDAFGVDPAGRTCLDVGASTGGFTDVLLRRGAARVYAVDVGYGQLAWALRQDPRVVVRERVNARRLTAEDVPEPVGLAAVDVSFISLAKVLPAVTARLAPGADLICLVKPQFEAGPADVPRGGVVRDPAVHRQVLRRVIAGAAGLGWGAAGLVPSPVAGAEGNREFLLHLVRGPGAGRDPDALVESALAAPGSA